MAKSLQQLRFIGGLVITTALEVKDLTGAEIESRWKQLVSRLHTGVGAFAALHSLAIRTMRFSPSWPKSVATRLGIPVTVATE